MNDSTPHTDSGTERISARRMLAVTEEELQRVVLDIHDGAVQKLYAALTQISVMQKQRAGGEEIAGPDLDKNLARLALNLKESLSEIRNFLGAFHSPDFSTRDLVYVMKGLILQHEAATGCQVDLSVDHAVIEAALPIKIALFRISQEALSNSFRHAGTDQQEIAIELENSMITLEISDRGSGFEPPLLAGPDGTEQQQHIGLRGMRDRIGLVGGEFELKSSPGKGTCIHVEVPAH